MRAVCNQELRDANLKVLLTHFALGTCDIDLKLHAGQPSGIFMQGVPALRAQPVGVLRHSLLSLVTLPNTCSPGYLFNSLLFPFLNLQHTQHTHDPIRVALLAIVSVTFVSKRSRR